MFEPAEVISARQKKQAKIHETLNQRYKQFVDYNRAITKKGLPINLLTGKHGDTAKES
jgi:hypothetical protein